MSLTVNTYTNNGATSYILLNEDVSDVVIGDYINFNGESKQIIDYTSKVISINPSLSEVAFILLGAYSTDPIDGDVVTVTPGSPLSENFIVNIAPAQYTIDLHRQGLILSSGSNVNIGDTVFAVTQSDGTIVTLSEPPYVYYTGTLDRYFVGGTGSHHISVGVADYFSASIGGTLQVIPGNGTIPEGLIVGYSGSNAIFYDSDYVKNNNYIYNVLQIDGTNHYVTAIGNVNNIGNGSPIGNNSPYWNAQITPPITSTLAVNTTGSLLESLSLVSGSSYIIKTYTGSNNYSNANLNLYGVNPAVEPVNNFIEYSGSIHWMYSINTSGGGGLIPAPGGGGGGYTYEVQPDFSTAPTVGVDTITYISTASNNQILSIDNRDGSLNVYSSSLNIFDQLTYNGQTKTVQDIRTQAGISNITLNSEFSGSLVGLKIGTDVTLTPLPDYSVLQYAQNGDPFVLFSLGDGLSAVAIPRSSVINVGDKLAYNGQNLNAFYIEPSGAIYSNRAQLPAKIVYLDGQYSSRPNQFDILSYTVGTQPLTGSIHTVSYYGPYYGGDLVFGLDDNSINLAGKIIKFNGEEIFSPYGSGDVNNFFYDPTMFTTAPQLGDTVEVLPYTSSSGVSGNPEIVGSTFLIKGYDSDTSSELTSFIFLPTGSAVAIGDQVTFNGQSIYVYSIASREIGIIAYLAGEYSVSPVRYSDYSEVVVGTGNIPVGLVWQVSEFLDTPNPGDTTTGLYVYSPSVAPNIGDTITIDGASFTITNSYDNENNTYILEFVGALVSKSPNRIASITTIAVVSGGKPSFSQATRVAEAKLMPTKETRVAEVNLLPAKEERVTEVNLVPANRDKTGLKN